MIRPKDNIWLFQEDRWTCINWCFNNNKTKKCPGCHNDIGYHMNKQKYTFIESNYTYHAYICDICKTKLYAYYASDDGKIWYV